MPCVKGAYCKAMLSDNSKVGGLYSDRTSVEYTTWSILKALDAETDQFMAYAYLSDETQIAGTTWAVLKEVAMEADYKTAYVSLSDETEIAGTTWS